LAAAVSGVLAAALVVAVSGAAALAASVGVASNQYRKEKEPMKTLLVIWKKYLAVLTLALCATIQLHAQPFPGFFGGFGGGANQNRATTSTTYNPAGSVGNANIMVEPDSRNIIINADDTTTKALLEVIKNLDRPQPQVLIKVVFLEVTHNNSEDIGIEGQYTGSSSVFGRIAQYVTNYSIFTNSTTTTPVGGGPSTVGTTTTILPSQLQGINSSYGINNNFLLAQQGANPNGAGTYTILGKDFTATLRAIAQVGKAQLLSRPSILARNNQPATIQVGQNVPLITAVTYDTFGNSHNSITYQPVGIILKVTPFITSEGLVQMIVQPSTSSIDQSVQIPVAAGVYAPAINVRSADTVVVTPDSQTVVIGGLMANADADTVSKIPILGDIPLLGSLFRHKTTANSKTELIIFLTPHVIQSPSQLAMMSESEKAHMLTPKSYSEEELDRFLEKVPVKKTDPKKK
jgi:general secretion pathway protein D